LKVILLAGRIFGALTLGEMLDRKDIAEIVGVVPGDDVVLTFAKSRGVNVVQCSDINSDEFISLVKSTQFSVPHMFIALQKGKVPHDQ